MRLNCHSFKKWASLIPKKTSGRCVQLQVMFMLLLRGFWGTLARDDVELFSSI
ncbi:hypothetical protein Hanom_Chr07g00587771 [Helianthus anomalus]